MWFSHIGHATRRWGAACVVALAAGTATAQVSGWPVGHMLEVPSGQDVSFLDVIHGEDSAVGSAVRYRFLAPRIARAKQDIQFMQAEGDMSALCQDYVLPQMVAAQDPLPNQIIIVLSDRSVEHGLADPDATQFFEAYRPEDGVCIWEGF